MRREGSEQRHGLWRMGVAFVVAMMVAAGCGGSDDAAEVTTTTTEPEAPSTTRRTTTTRPTTTAPSTTTTIDPARIAPLTGEVTDVGTDLTRPALVVKIDNHPDARPQTGLELADIVFDLRAEGVTRFTAVFHSAIPDPVGPVRSSRTSDFDLLWGFNNPLYASSGGNDYVMGALAGVDAIAVTNHSRPEYFRDGSRPAPHNLYVDGTDLYALAPEDGTEPPFPWFDYRGADGAPAEVGDPATTANGDTTVEIPASTDDDEPPSDDDPSSTDGADGTDPAADGVADDGADDDEVGDDEVEVAVGEPVPGPVTIAFREGPTVGFTWDEATQGWPRTQNGEPHVTVGGDQLAPANVVIMVTSYVRSPADAASPELVSTGSGDLIVLTDGHVITGTWERPEADQAPTLADDDGRPIVLMPGQTWVLYPEAGQVQY